VDKRADNHKGLLTKTHHEIMKQHLFGLLAGVCLLQQAACTAKTEWLTDLERAKAAAMPQNRMILMDFTGSDW
jgi:hypothetical protein